MLISWGWIKRNRCGIECSQEKTLQRRDTCLSNLNIAIRIPCKYKVERLTPLVSPPPPTRIHTTQNFSSDCSTSSRSHRQLPDSRYLQSRAPFILSATSSYPTSLKRPCHPRGVGPSPKRRLWPSCRLLLKGWRRGYVSRNKFDK
jgi:hypothetical protein